MAGLLSTTTSNGGGTQFLHIFPKKCTLTDYPINSPDPPIQSESHPGGTVWDRFFQQALCLWKSDFYPTCSAISLDVSGHAWILSRVSKSLGLKQHVPLHIVRCLGVSYPEPLLKAPSRIIPCWKVGPRDQFVPTHQSQGRLSVTWG